MEFICERCGYQVRQRCSLLRHLHKKTPCPAYMSSTDREALIRKIVECARPISVNMAQTNLSARDFSRDENVEYLLSNHELMVKCIRTRDVMRVIREINFNPLHQENHNIRVKDEMHMTMEYIDGGQPHECDFEFGTKYLLFNGWRVLDLYQNTNRGRLRTILSGPEWYECKKWIDNLTDEGEDNARKYRVMLEKVWSMALSVTGRL